MFSKLVDKWIIVPLRETIQSEIRAQTTALVKTIVVAITETVGEITVKEVDQITDMIPGQVDDHIVDGFVTKVFDRLHHLGF
jgi:hypothetical protein